MLRKLQETGTNFSKKIFLINLGVMIGLLIACNPLTSVSQSFDEEGSEKIKLRT